jgi:NADP-dependent 3-hydroxy acid dehydrogenase YdfG
MATADYFADKVVIITGASTGIGRALAIEVARAGARVVLASRNRERLEGLAGEIGGSAAGVLVVPTDVTNLGQVTELIERTLAEWGRIDVLIANAGLYVRGPVSTLTLADFETALDVNFYGMLRPVLGVLPVMLERRSGHIVLMSSVDGRKGLPLDAPYVAAKSAMRGFSDVLRQELHRTGVGLTIVYPGRVDTPMIDHLRFHPISAKISAEAVAKATLAGIRHNRVEVVIPKLAWALIYLDLLMPRVADWWVRFLHLQGWEQPGGPRANRE